MITEQGNTDAQMNNTGEVTHEEEKTITKSRTKPKYNQELETKYMKKTCSRLVTCPGCALLLTRGPLLCVFSPFLCLS